MDTGKVYAKTDKGHEEIEKRSYHLNFRHRTALILVDGENTADALLEKIPGDARVLLEDLLREGFITTAGEFASASGAPEAPSEGTTATAANFDIDHSKRQAVQMIESVLGPDGESLALAIERCQTHAEFSKQARRAREIILQVSGQRKATEFWTKSGL